MSSTLTRSPTAIRPLNDRILVRLQDPPDKVGRILLPDSAKEKPTTGEVLAVGSECADWTADLVGHVVVFHHYAGSLAPGTKDLMLVKELDLLAVQDKTS
jgi:chaperonin GroES